LSFDTRCKNRWQRRDNALTLIGVSVDDVTWARRLAQTGGARAIREGARLSVSELARELDVTPGTVSRWERGLRTPRGAAAERWAKLLRRLSAA
jgi:DNA-binding transcriptional regulator YiaG